MFDIQRHSFGLFLLSTVIFTGLVASGCSSTSNYAYKRSNAKWTETAKTEANQKSVNNIMKTAFSQVGNPYRYGGNTPETGFDCSGFVKWVYGQYGVQLPRSSSDMAGIGVPVSRDELRPGDLVFFAQRRGISHVGIYTGNDKYIHSPRTGKSIEEAELSRSNNRTRYVTARRVIDNNGITAINENLKNNWVAESRATLTASRGAAIAKKADKKQLTAKKQTTEKASAKNSKNSKSAKKSGKVKQHTVKSGDTIYDLSKKYGVSPESLAKANNLGKKAAALKLGQKLVVPTKN